MRSSLIHHVNRRYRLTILHLMCLRLQFRPLYSLYSILLLHHLIRRMPVDSRIRCIHLDRRQSLTLTLQWMKLFRWCNRKILRRRL